MSTTPCVLAVVSEPADFATLSAELQAAGVPVCRAEDLLDAILHQADSPASVILCDTENLDWAEALELFQRLKTPNAVVFLTRMADEHLWVQMLEAGAFDLLEKPCRPQDLRWVVSNALKRRAGQSAATAA